MVFKIAANLIGSFKKQQKGHCNYTLNTAGATRFIANNVVDTRLGPMSQNTAGSTRVPTRIISALLIVALMATMVLFTSSQAHADLTQETSREQVIGVGRVQSAAPVEAVEEVVSTEAEATQSEEVVPTEAVGQLTQPVYRNVENAEAAIADISLMQRFGEKDEAGWYTTISSAYGPSSAGTHTSLGTELTLTSMDIGCHINHIDVLMGRYVELSYGGKTLVCRVVDCGYMSNDGRLFDLQPGVCTYFGAETPEFGWGLRTIKWRFV